MAKRRHVSKRPIEQQYYVQRISRFGYEPTAEDELEIPEATDSDQPEEPTTIRTSGTRRPRNGGNAVLGHFKRNGAVYVSAFIVLLILIVSTFFFNISESIGRIEAVVERIKEDITKLELQINDIEEKIHNQDLKLQEQGMKIENLEKDSQ